MKAKRVIKMLTDRGYHVSVTYYPYGVSALIRKSDGSVAAEISGLKMTDDEMFSYWMWANQGWNMLDLQGGLEYVDSKEQEKSID